MRGTPGLLRRRSGNEGHPLPGSYRPHRALAPCTTVECRHAAPATLPLLHHHTAQLLRPEVYSCTTVRSLLAALGIHP